MYLESFHLNVLFDTDDFGGGGRFLFDTADFGIGGRLFLLKGKCTTGFGLLPKNTGFAGGF